MKKYSSKRTENKKEGRTFYMRKDYNKTKKAVVATLSVVALSLIGGLGYYVNQKDTDVDGETIVVEQEDSDVQIIAKADGKTTTKDSADKKKNKTKTGTSEESSKTISKNSANKDTGDGILTDKVRRPEDAVPPSAPPKNATNSSKNSGTKNSNKEKATNKNQSKNKSTNQNGKTTNKNNNSSKNKGKSQPYNGQIKGDMIYVEGFGWVKYSGGGSIVHDLPGAGTGEIVADM